jgi:hypothetical protein
MTQDEERYYLLCVRERKEKKTEIETEREREIKRGRREGE